MKVNRRQFIGILGALFGSAALKASGADKLLKEEFPPGVWSAEEPRFALGVDPASEGVSVMRLYSGARGGGKRLIREWIWDESGEHVVGDHMVEFDDTPKLIAELGLESPAVKNATIAFLARGVVADTGVATWAEICDRKGVPMITMSGGDIDFGSNTLVKDSNITVHSAITLDESDGANLMFSDEVQAAMLASVFGGRPYTGGDDE